MMTVFVGIPSVMLSDTKSNNFSLRAVKKSACATLMIGDALSSLQALQLVVQLCG